MENNLKEMFIFNPEVGYELLLALVLALIGCWRAYQNWRCKKKSVKEGLRANLNANLFRSGKNTHRLRVFNSGNGSASNVRLEIKEGASLFAKSEIEERLPLRMLAQHQNIEFTIHASLNSSRRIHLKIFWDDGAGENNEIERWLVF